MRIVSKRKDSSVRVESNQQREGGKQAATKQHKHRLAGSDNSNLFPPKVSSSKFCSRVFLCTFIKKGKQGTTSKERVDVMCTVFPVEAPIHRTNIKSPRGARPQMSKGNVPLPDGCRIRRYWHPREGARRPLHPPRPAWPIRFAAEIRSAGGSSTRAVSPTACAHRRPP